MPANVKEKTRNQAHALVDELGNVLRMSENERKIRYGETGITLILSGIQDRINALANM